jgi:hypothetical protein
VEPWLAPHALAGLDRATLAGLVTRSRQFLEQIGHRRRSLAPLVIALACALGAAAAGWFLLQAPGRRFTFDYQALRSLWTTLEAHPVLSLAVIVPVLLVSCFTVCGRIFRS